MLFPAKRPVGTFSDLQNLLTSGQNLAIHRPSQHPQIEIGKGGRLWNCLAMIEAEALAIVCAILGGEAEVTHSYSIDQGDKYIRVDCETETHAIEVGLDKRSSLDSVQQASFYSWLAGKDPMLLLIDTDGVEGAIEYLIETASKRLGVEYRVFSADFLLR